MAVKILKPTQVGTLYNEGEVAGFDEETEARLIEQGFAEAVTADKPGKGKGEQPAA